MRKSFFLLALLVFFSFSCVEENNPGTQDGTTVNENITLLSSEIVLSEKEQIAVLEFESSVAWTIEPINDRASGWCSVEPSSGDAGKASVVVSVNENLDFEDRQAVLLIKAGTCSETFVVSQKQKDALTVTSSRYEISSDGGTVDIDVSSNVEYEIVVPLNCDWVTNTNTKSLSSQSHSFNVAKNESYDSRSVDIMFKEVNGDISEIVTIEQSAIAEFTLELSLEGEKTDAGFKLRATASEDPDYYLYWCGEAEWKSVTEIEESMKSEPESFIKAVPGNSEDIVDGCFVIGGAPEYFSYYTEYLFVVIAVKLEGEQLRFSQSAHFIFQYDKNYQYISSVDDNGMSNMEWAAKRPVLTFDDASFEAYNPSYMFGRYSFSMSCPKDMTAYIMCCGNISPYMSSVSQLIDEIITVSDKCVQSDVLVSEDDWMTLGFHHGWKYQKYAHGCPLYGYCVYLPEDYSSAADPVYLHLQDEIKQLQEKYPEGSGAYYDYYKDAVPICCVNDGTSLTITNPYAYGDKSGVDRDYVFVLLEDAEGMYYEPYQFVVPNCFK